MQGISQNTDQLVSLEYDPVQSAQDHVIYHNMPVHLDLLIIYMKSSQENS
jgi:hypothetical protein